MNFNELAKSRKSIRGFKETEISAEDITRLLEAAQAAPSAGNCQPWHFYVVTGAETRKRINERVYNPAWMLTAPVVIVICADIQKTIGRYGDRGRNLYCIQDTAAAIQNILLCAKSLGLGACWCGAFDEDEMSAILHLDAEMRPIAMIPIGYAVDDNPPERKRRPLEEIATFIQE